MSDVLSKPTIKGIFLKSHVQAVKEKKGEEGLQKLQQCMGKSLDYKNNEDIPISEEVQLLEYALPIVSDSVIDESQKHFEAGKLHFKNFTTTPLAKIIFSVFKSNFKLMMMQAQHIAGHIFQRVKFTSEDINEKTVKVIMENNDYPIDHFRGLFDEWMHFSGLNGTVEAKEDSRNRYEYLITWK